MFFDDFTPLKAKNMIIKKGEMYHLISKSTGKTLGKHKTRALALQQEKAIQMAKMKRGKHMPKMSINK